MSLKDQVYELILEDILSYEYKPNDILNEKALVEKYSYSKTPVREALLSLCNDKILRNIPRCGYEVIRITTDDIRDLLQYRYITEKGLLTFHYTRFSEQQLNRLAALDEKCAAYDRDIWEHWKYNTEFHLQLVAFCNNSYALEIMQKTMNRLRQAYAQLCWNNLQDASLAVDTQYHAHILENLRARNLEGVLHYLKRDLSSFGSSYFNLELSLDSFDEPATTQG